MLGNYRDIIIHCGLHKTGTSYLQQMFFANRVALARHSIHYPSFKSPAGDIYEGNHSVTVAGINKSLQVEATLSRSLDLESDCDCLLISGEGFLKIENHSAFLESLRRSAPNARIQLIFYLRRFDHLIEGVYIQRAKQDLCGDITDAPYPLNFNDLLAPFIAAFGRDDVILRPYNKLLWTDGSLGADFLGAIGAPEAWTEMEQAKDDRVNEALTRPETFLLSRLRSPAAKKLLLRRLVEYPLADYRDKARFFRSPQDRQRMNKTLEAANQHLADVFRLGSIAEFLNLHDYSDDPDWTPFEPSQERLMIYLAGFADQLAEPLSVFPRL
ncbi:hypothetical protein [Mesorhizobium xinjiangense]|uniref:hypothetical protein n=1 Tax=Mesorhizobium xinjiangense TaxID=2678685 RepID=UPI0012EEDBA4|nr:hypothetical protein [Mesorhizobium xinjiangense]